MELRYVELSFAKIVVNWAVTHGIRYEIMNPLDYTLETGALIDLWIERDLTEDEMREMVMGFKNPLDLVLEQGLTS